MKLEIIKPFGPSIVKLKIPNDIVIEMNRYTVYPFIDSDDERRSVSFNAAIDSSAASL